MDWHPLPLADESEVRQAFSGSLSQLTEHFAAVNVSKISPTVSSTDATRHDLHVAKQSYLTSSAGDCSSTPQKNSSLCSSLPGSKAALAKEADSISNFTSGEPHNLQRSTHTSVDSSSRSGSAAADQQSTTRSLPSEASQSAASLSSGDKADCEAGNSSHHPSDGHLGPPPDLSVGDITGNTTPGMGADGSHTTNDSTPDFTPPHSFVPATHQVISSSQHSSRWSFQQERQVRIGALYEHSGGQGQSVQSKGVTSVKKDRQVAFSERPLSKNPQAPTQSAVTHSAPMKDFSGGPRQLGLRHPSPVLPSLSELRKGPQFVQFFLPKKIESEDSTSTPELSSTLQTGSIDSSTVTHTFPSSMDTHTLPLPKHTPVGAHALHGARDPSSNTSTSTDMPSQEPTSEDSTHEVAETVEAVEDPSLNVSSSTHILSKEATSEESTHEVIETLAAEAVRKSHSKPTQVVPGRDLDQLDRLWEDLLKSPYATTRALHQSTSRGHADGVVGGAFQQDPQRVLQMLGSLDVGKAAVLPELDHIKCTCSARERWRAAEGLHPTTHTSRYGARSTGALQKQSRPTHSREKEGGSPSLRQAPVPKANAQYAAPRHEAVRRRAKNRAVQTSPSLFQCQAPRQENGLHTPDNKWAPLPSATMMTDSGSKAVSFTVSHTSPLGHDDSSSTVTPSPRPHHTEGHSVTASSFDSSLTEPSQPQIRTLAPLSLQEACQLYKKAFISHSQQRQLFIQTARKQRDELDQLSTGGILHSGPTSVRGGEMGQLHPTTPQAQTMAEQRTTAVLAPSWIPIPRRKLGKELQAEMKAKARRYRSSRSTVVGLLRMEQL